MKILVVLLLIIVNGLQSYGQDIRCYCFEKNAPALFNLQTEATKIVEWIVIKDDLAAVISYMDKPCEQPWAFYIEKFNDHKDKNRLYQITELGDSIIFTKVFNFTVKDQDLKQEYVYNVKVYSDSLNVHIDYPPSDNSPNKFNDLAGSPDRTYIRIFKK